MPGFDFGSMLGGLFGMGSGSAISKNTSDPLAGIRNQLMQMSGQVQPAIDKMKSARADEYKYNLGEGQKGIQENFHAVRGFGDNSLETKITNDFIANLSRNQAMQDAQDQWAGLNLQRSFLNDASQVGSTPDAGAELAGQGAGMFGNALGSIDWGQLIGNMFKGSGNKTQTQASPALQFENYNQDMNSRPGFVDYRG